MAAKPLSPLPSPASAARSPPVHSGASGLPPFLINSAEWLMAFPEKAMAPHSSTLAWKIPWTEEPGRLQSMGSPRVRHD